ncbi:MAG: putative manganese-dependent inorganic diphosphatase [Treponema sp.]|nr:putative manganese-dependent inorganic diphosphatase [Treponema sp.]
MEKTVYIFGHKNPDTDAVVAAYAYAKLKELLGCKNYVAARAGHLSPQTEYIFNKFKIKAPEHISELNPKTAFYMSGNCTTVNENSSLWEALKKIDTAQSQVLPVVDDKGYYKSLLHYNEFAKNVLLLMNPEKKTPVTTSIELIMQTMKAQPIILKNEKELFKASILVGSSATESFVNKLDQHKSEQMVVIASNRPEIHEQCIDAKVRLLVLTSGHVLSKELRAKAEKNGVSVIISPYGTSSTSMLIAYSTPVIVMADRSIPAVQANDTIGKIKPLLRASPCRCLPVVDEEYKVMGVISESDLLREPNIELIFVDHNEASQAVEGFEHYKILEVIDHHRIGTLSTKNPITFINKPVGSTSTLITGLFRENKISIPLETAELLLCGILSDTLILKSTTVTDVDREAVEYLSAITNLDPQALGEEIIRAGSSIVGRGASEIIKQDLKEYTEGKLLYSVSQIEVDNTRDVLNRKKEFLDILESERAASKRAFAALLVTDIGRLDSIMILAVDEKYKSLFTFPKQEDNVYFLKGVVSRKKQLIPMLTELLAGMAE